MSHFFCFSYDRTFGLLYSSTDNMARRDVKELIGTRHAEVPLSLCSLAHASYSASHAYGETLQCGYVHSYMHKKLSLWMC